MKKNLTTKMIVLLGLLTAAEIVLSRFCSFNTWNLKIGVSFIPVALAAMLWGPISGGIVAALGDFLGAILFPIGAYFPGFTATAFLTGCVYGLFLYRKQSLPRVLCVIAVNGVMGTLLLNTLWISIAYGSPFGATFVSRLVQAGAVAVFQFFVLSAMGRLLPRIRPFVAVSPKEQRQNQRRAGMAARNNLDPRVRATADAVIIKTVTETAAWKDAKVIMSYAAVRSEVNLSGLEAQAVAQGKILVYPVCTSANSMVACAPAAGFPTVFDPAACAPAAGVDASQDMAESVKNTASETTSGDDPHIACEPVSSSSMSVDGESVACNNMPAGWRIGMYKIPEPDPETARIVEPTEIDLVLCPCSTFDDNCNRMGMGAGYYDRYLEACTSATLIAIAYEAQHQRRLLTEEWDKPMDMVITEKRVITRKKQNPS